MWNHSSNLIDSVFAKQQYEQKYYLCSALLEYSATFYKSEYLNLKNSDFKIIKDWPESGSGYSGKIIWLKLDSKITIKAELIKNSNIEFAMQEILILKVKDDTGTIDVVIFKNSIKNIENITSGKTFKIKGKPEKYKEKMEIIATAIQ